MNEEISYYPPIICLDDGYLKSCDVSSDTWDDTSSYWNQIFLIEGRAKFRLHRKSFFIFEKLFFLIFFDVHIFNTCNRMMMLATESEIKISQMQWQHSLEGWINLHTLKRIFFLNISRLKYIEDKKLSFRSNYAYKISSFFLFFFSN